MTKIFDGGDLYPKAFLSTHSNYQIVWTQFERGGKLCPHSYAILEPERVSAWRGESCDRLVNVLGEYLQNLQELPRSHGKWWEAASYSPIIRQQQIQLGFEV